MLFQAHSLSAAPMQVMFIVWLSQFVVFCFPIPKSMHCPSRNGMVLGGQVVLRSRSSTVHVHPSLLTREQMPPMTMETGHLNNTDRQSSPLSLEFGALSRVLGGKGRAKMVWDCLRRGVDPLHEFNFMDGNEQRGDGCDSEFGQEAKSNYVKHFGGSSIQDSVSKVINVHVSSDGTIKLLLSLQSDGLEVETVIIPWSDRKKSTLCISSQVGCRQGCTFCMTGRMGKLRSLTADEILSQVFHAVATVTSDQSIYPIDNIVFMGMGEPGDNAQAVLTVTNILVDDNQFQFELRRVTISTVAPDPSTFVQLGEAPAVLAWSVHSSRDELRRQLVPTTKHSMDELREGLIQALQQRPRRLQSIMLEVTLLDGINDSTEDASDLADFCFPIHARVPNGRVVVNLIPWNDISASSGPARLYRPPSQHRLLAFHRTLVDRGLRCYIRTTRGDDESAACGQLATGRNKM